VTVSGAPTIIKGKVIVGKNPCYHLGDIRILEAVDIPENHFLVDCLVFSVQGERPTADKIAGSDLDGDQFFVSWEPSLIPQAAVLPFAYTPSEAPEKSIVTQSDIISSFAEYPTTLVGRLNATFNYWIDRKGILSPECEEINRLFARAIDAAKTGDKVNVPKRFKQPPPEDRDVPPDTFVWQKLMTAAKKFSEISLRECISDPELSFDKKTLLHILKERKIQLGDSELFRFCAAWSRENSEDIMEFVDWIDFSRFGTYDIQFAIDCGVPPKIILNALNKSKILTPAQLSKFHLDVCTLASQKSSRGSRLVRHRLMFF
jgi:regulator of nonsense transcripts 1